MTRVLVVMDSLKGSLSSREAATAIETGLRGASPSLQIESFPLADGGEGSVSVLHGILGGSLSSYQVCGPLGSKVEGAVLITNRRDAYVELASASGITHVVPSRETCVRATTFGTGELLRHALNLQPRSLTLCVGGSATTDGGVGIAKALGWRFLDARGAVLPSIRDAEARGDSWRGERLSEIASIEPPPDSMPAIPLRVVADVRNPLLGANGSAAVYGPQKGAGPEEVTLLDAGLANLARVADRHFKGGDVHEIPGSGAAGGAAFGMLRFLGAALVSGPRFFLNAIDFDEKLAGVRVIVTGEGQADRQSLEGKLLAEILERAAGRATVFTLSGQIDLDAADLARFPNLRAFGLGHARGRTEPKAALELLAAQIGRLISND